jgi:tetratricopeptide (TPR) repeat protein
MATALRPQFKVALDHLIDIGEIYLQLLSFLAISELAKYEGKRTARTREVVDMLRSSALSAGHWLSILKLCAAELSELADNSPGLFGKDISKLLGADRLLLEDVDRWPSLRNDTKHDYTKTESAAEKVYEQYRPRLESLLAHSELLSQVTLFSVSDAVFDTDENVYEISCFVGMVPERNISIVKTPPEIRLSSGAVFAGRRALIDSSQLRDEHEFMSLDPWILMPKSGSGLVFFNSCKRKKVLYQDTGLESQGRWEDAGKYKFVTEFLDKLLAQAPADNALSGDIEWTGELKVLAPVVPRQVYPEANPQAFFHGQPISIGELAADWDIRRIIYFEGNAVPYDEFLSNHVSALSSRARTFSETPVVAFLGPGGSGKSTILWRTCFDIAKDNSVAVLRLLPSHRIDAAKAIADLVLAMDRLGSTSVALFIDEAAVVAEDIGSFVKELRFRGIPACIYLAEQMNHAARFGFSYYVYELRNLTEVEVDDLLSKLSDADSLGYLGQLGPVERKKFFMDYSNKEILVALRESMEGGKRFDQIVYDEFRRIPDSKGQELYRVAAIYHACESYYPLEASRSYLGLTQNREAWRHARASCRGVLLEEPYSGGLKSIRGRHRIISSILLDKLYPLSDEQGDFFDDLDSSFEAMIGIMTPMTERSITAVVIQVSLASPVLNRLKSVGDFESYSFSVCRFESNAGGKPNYFLLGIVSRLVSGGHIDQAIGLLHAAGYRRITAAPGESWFTLSRLLIKRASEGDLEAAVSAAFQAMEYKQEAEDFQKYCLQLAKALETRKGEGDIDLAIQLLTEALAVGSNRGIVVIRLSLMLETRKDEGDIDLAIQLLTETLDVGGDRGNVVIRLSHMLESRKGEGDIDRAIRLLTETLDVGGNGGHVVIRLSHMLESRKGEGDIDRAIELLTETLDIGGNDGSVVIRLSHLLESRKGEGDIDRAIELLTETLDIGGNDGSVVIHLSLMLESRKGEGDIDRAIRLLTETLDVGGNEGSVVIRLSHMLESRKGEGDMDRAIELLTAHSDVTDIGRREIRLMDCLESRNADGDINSAIQVGERARSLGVKKGHEMGIILRIGRLRKMRQSDDDLLSAKHLLESHIQNYPSSGYLTSSVQQLLTEINHLLENQCAA